MLCCKLRSCPIRTPMRSDKWSAIADLLWQVFECHTSREVPLQWWMNWAICTFWFFVCCYRLEVPIQKKFPLSEIHFAKDSSVVYATSFAQSKNVNYAWLIPAIHVIYCHANDIQTLSSTPACVSRLSWNSHNIAKCLVRSLQI